MSLIRLGKLAVSVEFRLQIEIFLTVNEVTLPTFFNNLPPIKFLKRDFCVTLTAYSLCVFFIFYEYNNSVFYQPAVKGE